MSSKQFSLVKQEESDIKLENSSKSKPENQDTSPKDAEDDQEKNQGHDTDKEDEEKQMIKLENSSQSKLENLDFCQETASEVQEKKQEHDADKDDNDDEEDQSRREAKISSRESENPRLELEQSKVAEDDEGFVTPTSSDHKIPVISQCPPAPKKTRLHPSTKRKESSMTSTSFQLNILAEVESIFPPIPEDDLHPKTKKARKDDED